jgi:hypothetical protein
MRTVIAALLIAASTPALAQFPPPGVYRCADDGNVFIGELTLFVAGDYSFKGTDGNSASGQLASAGTDINPLSGPFKEMGLHGSFETIDVVSGSTFTPVTVLNFTTPKAAKVTCSTQEKPAG